ncbi:phospholipid scramblase 2-like isoform X2 [Ornithodoros turicata]|uniref:phospholipid scramblase 2-like isoform X2 n=1 Tax=Ornithodoros turicata TaxID=34597 RepID=UPI00313885B2
MDHNIPDPISRTVEPVHNPQSTTHTKAASTSPHVRQRQLQHGVVQDQHKPIQEQPVSTHRSPEPKSPTGASRIPPPLKEETPGDLSFLDDRDHLIINCKEPPNEEQNCCEHLCCLGNASCALHGVDVKGRPVLELYRPLRCQSGIRGYYCCGFSRQEMHVKDTSGEAIGFVFENATWGAVSLSICDASRKPFLKVDGPCFAPGTARHVALQAPAYNASIAATQRSSRVLIQLSQLGLRSLTGEIVGSIIREENDAMDAIVLSFPRNLSRKEKACVLASGLSLWFMMCTFGHLYSCFLCALCPIFCACCIACLFLRLPQSCLYGRSSKRK